MSTDLKITETFLAHLWSLADVPRPAFRLMGWNRQIWQPPAGLSINPALHEKFISQMQTALEVLTYPDDGMPLLNSYIHIGMHASAFGSQIIREAGQEPKVLPVIHSVDDFPKLAAPHHNEETRLAFEFNDLLAAHCRPGWRVSHADLQGPTDSGSLIWDYTDMLVSGYSDPDLVHQMLGRVTQFIIDFEHEQVTRVPDLNLNHNPSIWLPKRMGVSASEDLLAVVSPQWYEQFGLPYNNRLAEHFNGLFIHTCGKFTQNLPVLQKHNRLRGVNFNLGEVEIEPLLDALAGRCVLTPRLGLGGNERLLRKYVGYLKDKGFDHTHHFYIIDSDGHWPLERALELLVELGIAPKDAQ